MRKTDPNHLREGFKCQIVERNKKSIIFKELIQSHNELSIVRSHNRQERIREPEIIFRSSREDCECDQLKLELSELYMKLSHKNEFLLNRTQENADVGRENLSLRKINSELLERSGNQGKLIVTLKSDNYQLREKVDDDMKKILDLRTEVFDLKSKNKKLNETVSVQKIELDELRVVLKDYVQQKNEEKRKLNLELKRNKSSSPATPTRKRESKERGLFFRIPQKRFLEFDLESRVNACVYNSYGNIIACGTSNGRIELIVDRVHLKEAPIVSNFSKDSITKLDFSANDKLLLGVSSNTIRIWNVYKSMRSNAFAKKPKYNVELMLTGHEKRILDAKFFGADPLKCVSTAYDRSMKVWDVKTGKERLEITNVGHSINVIQVEGSSVVYTAHKNGDIKVFDLRTGTRHNQKSLVREMQEEKNVELSNLCLNNFEFFTTSYNSVVNVFDKRKFELVCSFVNPRVYQNYFGRDNACYSPCGKFIVLGGKYGALSFVQISKGRNSKRTKLEKTIKESNDKKMNVPIVSVGISSRDGYVMSAHFRTIVVYK